MYIASTYAKKLKDDKVTCVLLWYGNKENPFLISLGSVFNKVYNVGIIYFHNDDKKNKKYSIKYNMLRLFTFIRYFRLYIIANKIFKKKHNSILCVFSDVAIDAQFLMEINKRNNSKNMNILIDEGIGLYLNRKEKKDYSSLFRKILKLYRFNPSSNISIGEYSDLDAIFAKEPNDLPEFLKKSNKDIIQQDTNYIFCKETTEWFLEVLDIDIKPLVSVSDKVVVILGQPLRFLGMDEDKEIKIWESIFKIIPESYAILIKPHPTDKKNKYNSLLKSRANISILDNNYALLPIELIFSQFNRAITISAFSSATMNVKYINEKIYNIYIYKILGLDKVLPDTRMIELLKYLGDSVQNIVQIESILTKGLVYNNQLPMDKIGTIKYLDDTSYLRSCLSEQ